MLIVWFVASLALQIWTWRRLVARIRSVGLTKFRAIGLYGAWAFVPLLLAAAAVLTVVAVEEWSGAALLSDSMGRAMPLLVLGIAVVALVGWVSFALRCARMNVSH